MQRDEIRGKVSEIGKLKGKDAPGYINGLLEVSNSLLNIALQKIYFLAEVAKMGSSPLDVEPEEEITVSCDFFVGLETELRDIYDITYDAENYMDWAKGHGPLCRNDDKAIEAYQKEQELRHPGNSD